MKKAKAKKEDEVRPEYDLSKLKEGVRGKYFKRYQTGTNLALLCAGGPRRVPDRSGR